MNTLDPDEEIGLFIYGDEQAYFPRRRNISSHIKDQSIAIGRNCNLFMTIENNFPILALGKGSDDSYLLGEYVLITQSGLESQKRMYKKEFPEVSLMRINVQSTDIFDIGKYGPRADSEERIAFTFGLPFKEALTYVSKDRLRFSTHNSYSSEMTDLSRGKAKREKKVITVPIIEKGRG